MALAAFQRLSAVFGFVPMRINIPFFMSYLTVVLGGFHSVRGSYKVFFFFFFCWKFLHGRTSMYMYCALLVAQGRRVCSRAMMLPNMVAEHCDGPKRLLALLVLCAALSNGKWTQIQEKTLEWQELQFTSTGPL